MNLVRKESPQVMFVVDCPTNKSIHECFLMALGDNTLKIISKNPELPIIVIGIQIILALKALDEQHQTYLNILHGTFDDWYPPLLVRLPALFDPLFICFPNMLHNLIVIEVQVIEVS